MMTMRSLNDKDFYFICMESVTKGFNEIGDVSTFKEFTLLFNMFCC